MKIHATLYAMGHSVPTRHPIRSKDIMMLPKTLAAIATTASFGTFAPLEGNVKPGVAFDSSFAVLLSGSGDGGVEFSFSDPGDSVGGSVGGVHSLLSTSRP